MLSFYWPRPENRVAFQKSAFRVLHRCGKNGIVRGNIALHGASGAGRAGGEAEAVEDAQERDGGEGGRNCRVTRAVNTLVGAQRGQR